MEVSVNRAYGADSHKLPIFMQSLTTCHPSRDDTKVAAIDNISIAVTDHVLDSWFETEIPSESNGQRSNLLTPQQTILRVELLRYT